MEKNSKSRHRLLRFDSPALCLTKTSWVGRPMTGDRYLIDGVVRASSDLCVRLKVESVNPGWRNDDTTSDRLGSQSQSEWTLGSWKKVEKFSKSQNARRLRTIFFLCIERGTRHLWDGKKILSFFTGSYGLTRPLSVWQRPHELKANDRRDFFRKAPLIGISSTSLWAKCVFLAMSVNRCPDDCWRVADSTRWVALSERERRSTVLGIWKKIFSKKFLSTKHRLWRIMHLPSIEDHSSR